MHTLQPGREGEGAGQASQDVLREDLRGLRGGGRQGYARLCAALEGGARECEEPLRGADGDGGELEAGAEGPARGVQGSAAGNEAEGEDGGGPADNAEGLTEGHDR